MAEALTLGNWIPDENKFNLPEPPAWFLKRLFDFDAQLVLVPSRGFVSGVPPAYLLCRRRQFSAGLGDVAMLDNRHPDTNMCYRYSIVPIAPLRFNNGASTFTESGCESLLKELRARDTWALTGGPSGDPDAAWKAVEAAEAAAEKKQRDDLKDSFRHRARDAWRSMSARAGWRNRRASDYHGAARAPKPQSSQRVTLTDAT